MAASTFDGTVNALLALCNSSTPLTQPLIDDIVDPYLVDLTEGIYERRLELAQAFRAKARSTFRADHIYERVLRRIIP